MRPAKSTIADIARELNITASTVSRALNNHAGISTSTKHAVQKAAKKLDYQHNKVASSLRLGRTRILGVIIPSAEINFFGSVVHGIEKIANENGYNILLYQSNEQFDYEKKAIETFLRLRVEGVLASISKETTTLAHFRKITKRGVPLVLFDRADSKLKVPFVAINDYKGAYNATAHLIEQGCRRIAHIAGQQYVAIFSERFRGYIDALRDHSIKIDDSLIEYGDISIQSGIECTQKLLQLKNPPDGIFAVEDCTALGSIQALKAASLKIPEDVAVIGFANEAFGGYITPSLSTVDQQTKKMGETAARIFFQMADDSGQQIDQTILLEPVMIFRDSSRKRTVVQSTVS